MKSEHKAVLLIDLQNDYFQDGTFPLWHTEQTLANVLKLIGRAQSAGDTLIHVQHIADPAMGLAPFFNKGTPGGGDTPPGYGSGQ